MTDTLIAIDKQALEGIRSELQRLHARLDAVEMTPQPKWITVGEMADKTGKSTRTIIRWIEAGKITSKVVGGTRMVRSVE